MHDWQEETVGACLEPQRLSSFSKIQTREYKRAGAIPIVDQGRKLIAGWTDDADAMISEGLPVVVFGDHSRTFKFIDFPFARGADGTQILKPKLGIDPLYFYFACRALELKSQGYNRHFKALKESKIRLPRQSEQSEIAQVLDRVARAVELQDRILSVLSDGKAIAMRQLFTTGLMSEPRKMTEIGLMPESWEFRPIGDFAKQMQYGLSVRGESSGRFPILRMNCQSDGKVVFRDLQYVTVDDATATAYRVKSGDILFNRTNSYELVGRTALVDSETDAVFASYLVRVSVDEQRLDPRFLNFFLNWDNAQSELRKLASRGVSQANISAGKLRTFRVPVPLLVEQHQIVDVLDAVDRKIHLHRQKHAVLDACFKSLLHQLMNGEGRVSDLDLSAIAPASKPEAES